jgi:lysophospholipase
MSLEPKYDMLPMHDNVFVHCGKFDPDMSPKGVIQAIHGFGVHIDRYLELADYFNENGYAFVIHDQRGFGMMPGTTKAQRQMAQGVVADYQLLMDDVSTIREQINLWYPGLPVILYGQSMGGNIAINYLLNRKKNDYTKLILESPWLRLYAPLSRVVTFCARVMGKISHRFAVVSRLEPDKITRCEPTGAGLAKDEFYHNRISLKLFTQISDAGERAIKNAQGVRIPTLLMCAGHDRIVSTPAIHEFYDNADENVVLVDYPDGYHSLHTDIIKKQVFECMLEFCDEKNVDNVNKLC